ncbi:UbiA prenyltransferase [Pleurotus pulmonarius]
MDTVKREIRLFFDFTWRDWSATLIPGLIVATGAVKHASLPAWNVVRFIPIEEDRINKPDRPLPSGKITVQGAKRRWAIALATFLSTALFDGRLIVETATWIATTAFLCLSTYGGHWFGKNVVAMGIGSWALWGGIYKTIARPTATEERFFLVVSMWIAIALQIQDLRDTEGDTAAGRRTLPIVVGDRRSRWLISLAFLPLSYATLWLGGVISLAPSTVSAAHVLLAYRTLRGTDAEYDHKTYMLLTYLFCYVVALPIWCEPIPDQGPY